MSDLHQLLICVGSGLILLILVSGFSHFISIEVPLLRRVPLGLIIAVAISLYGCFGLIVLGIGQTILTEFTLTPKIKSIVGISAIVISYYFGKIIMQMFLETPHTSFSDRALGLTATIRYAPQLLPSVKPGDALVFDQQEKITQIVTVYLADWVEEKELVKNDTVWIIDYLPDKNAFLVIKTGGIDELNWQNLQFSN